MDTNLKKEYDILLQYPICGYFVDGYIPELNLVVEIDEPHHYNFNNKLRQKDIKRQNIIKEKLNCEFLRIKDDFSACFYEEDLYG